MMSKQKIAFITGANKGIGYQIAEDLGKKDFKILLGARSSEKGKQASEILTKKGIDVDFVKIDVSDSDSIKSAFENVRKSYETIDVLINNAGILNDSSHSILDVPVNVSVETLQTNALGALWTTQLFFPLLKKGSRVVMMSSGLGKFCEGVSDYAPIYSISKTMMNAITLHLAKEFSKQGMIVNAMSPGWVKSDMGGQAASRTLSEGADTAVWLSSDAPDTINGQFLMDRKPISW